VVTLIGIALGDFPVLAVFTVLPVTIVSSLLFAGLGLTVSARAKTIDEISYPQFLIVFPMFLFCGVFYPIETLPSALQWVAWVLPLTSVLSLVRTLTLGFPFQPWAVPILGAWLLLLVAFSRRSMFARLVK
jgi:lipooligosaccharide transport system permease protein